MDSIFVYTNPDAAPSSGPLQGLKIALQPNISVVGWPADAGSTALVNFAALEDATIVRRLRQAGASLYGATYMSEFGFGLDNSKAGEALQQNEVDVELVLDLMGESRLAASRAAVCGFKPSYGLVSRFGLIGLIPSLECCGLLSRNLKMIREILKLAAGPDDLDFSLPLEEVPDLSPWTIHPEKIIIGIIQESLSGLQTEKREKFLSSIEELKNMDFTILEMSLPDFSLFSLVHKIVGSVEASSCAGRYDSVRYGQRAPGAKNWNEMYLLSRGKAFGSLLKSYLFQGAFFQFEHYKAFEDACRIRARLLAEMQRITSEVDILVLPAIKYNASGASSVLADAYAQFSTMLFANVTGQPALYLPPVTGTLHDGIQLVGPRLSDGRLLDLGEYLLKTRGEVNKDGL